MRIIEYPHHHLNDFCLFQAEDGRWHALGIMGTGTWDSERQLFHSVGASLSAAFENLSPVLTERPAGGARPQKHAPFVLLHDGTYHLFYRRPMGTILHARSKDPSDWHDAGTEIFTDRDARDVQIVMIDGTFHMYYCQCSKVEGEHRSCILLRRSRDLEQWSDGVVVHVDTAQPCTHSYLESPFVVARREGFYLFIRHRLLDENSSTVVLYSRRPDEFPSGTKAWFSELPGVHAPEIVKESGEYYIARVSGAPHASRQAPPRGGWVEVASLEFG